MIRKLLLVAAATAMPLGFVVATTGVASAKGAPPDSGTTTCGLTATATLSVPFTLGGVPGTKKATTTVSNQVLSGCTGSSTVTGGTPSTALIKTKFAKGVVPAPQDCLSFVTNPGSVTLPPFKEKVVWADNTKSVIAFTGGGASGVGFSLNGSVTKGSFVGEPVHVQVNLDTPSILAVVACSTGGGPVSGFNFDASSTLSIG